MFIFHEFRLNVQVMFPFLSDLETWKKNKMRNYKRKSNRKSWDEVVKHQAVISEVNGDQGYTKIY